MSRTILTSYKGIPYEIALAKRDQLLAALDAILLGQSYTIGSRTLTRASLSAIQEALKYYADIVDACESGRRIRIQRAVPQDF